MRCAPSQLRRFRTRATLAVSLLAALATPALQCSLIEQASAAKPSDLTHAVHGTAHRHDHQHHGTPTPESRDDTNSCCSNGSVLASVQEFRLDETGPPVKLAPQTGFWSTSSSFVASSLAATRLCFLSYTPPLQSEKLFLTNSSLLI